MLRATMIVVLLAGLILPLSATTARPAAAAATMTFNAVDIDAGGPARGACYSASDLVRGGGIGSACDWHDGTNDGTTTITSNDPCSSCRFTQSFPDDPDTGQPTIYLPAQPFDQGFGGSVIVGVRAKPYIIATIRDAKSGNLLPGVCITVQDLDRGGGAAAGCDGAPTDLDGARNGRITTKRILPGNYRVHQGTVPPTHLKGAPVDVTTTPGVVARVELLVPRRPRIAITTVDNQTGARLRGACYTIADLTHGGGLGTFCDGEKSGLFGDQDGLVNGVILTRPLEPDTTYRLHEQKPPRGYRVAADKDVTTQVGVTTRVTFKNRKR